jgi:hypothetical protein
MQSITFPNDQQEPPQRAKSWQRFTKFKEQTRLSTNTQPIRSSFSPDTPTSPSRSAFSPWTRRPSEPKVDEKPTTKKFTLLTGLFSKRSQAPLLPEPATAPPTTNRTLSPWPPLKVNSQQEEAQKQNKRRRLVTIGIVTVIILILLAAVIAIVVILKRNGGATDPSATPFALSADTAQCVTTFQVNASASPQTYPCGSCFGLLRAVPDSFASTNPADAQLVGAALQFCALKSIFDATGGNGTPGGDALKGAKWMGDTKTCTWSGVTCNGRGQISLLELVSPGIPAAFTAEISALTALESLKVTGNNELPTGLLPPLAPSLRILQLTQTGIQSPLPDGLFNSSSKLEQFNLVKNPKLGADLPASITSLTTLTSLIVNGQNTTLSLDSIASSPSLAKTLKTLDFSSNNINKPIPDMSQLTNLVKLDLSGNAISLLPPTTNFPPSLRVLSLAANTGLFGTLPTSLCSNAALQTCDLRGTLFTSASPCGACQFS